MLLPQALSAVMITGPLLPVVAIIIVELELPLQDDGSVHV
jgi:hypothetical protein